MKKIFLFSLYSIFFTFLNAQTYPPFLYNIESDEMHRTPFQIEFDMGLAFPVGHFKSEIDRGVLGGASVGFLYRFKRLPVLAGLRIGGLSYDHVRRKFDSGSFVQITKNKIWLWSGNIRYEKKLKDPFFLYFEGSVGLRRYYTKTYSKETGCVIWLFSEDMEYPRFDRKKLHSDWGMAFGGSTGIAYHFKEESASGIYAQLGFTQSGSDDFYARIGDPPVQTEPLLNYTKQHAALSMLSARVGVWAIIGTYGEKAAKRKEKS